MTAEFEGYQKDLENQLHILQYGIAAYDRTQEGKKTAEYFNSSPFLSKDQ